MNNCGVCKSAITQGVQCSSCKESLHHKCGGTSEENYKKLKLELRSTWRCSRCKSSNITVGVQDLSTIMEDIKKIQMDLSSFKALHEDIKLLRDEVQGIQKSVNSCHLDVATFNNKIANLENRLKKVEKLEEEVLQLRQEVRSMTDDSNKKDQWARLQNLEIRGIPEKKGENLITLISNIASLGNMKLGERDMEFATRVAPKGSDSTGKSKPKSVIVKLTNRNLKNQLLQAIKDRKGISSTELGFTGTPQNVYVGDHLTSMNKHLFYRARLLAKQKGYQFVWTKNCLIHARRNTTSAPIIISKEADLKKMDREPPATGPNRADAEDPQPSKASR